MIDGLLAFASRTITGCRGRWAAPPPSPAQPAVFFGNHTSHLDALAIWAALPPQLRRRCRPVAARDYWQKTSLRRFVAERALRALLIERRNVDRRNNPLPLMTAALDAGDSLILFPEGTRSDEAGGVFRAGLYHLAHKRPDIPLVPVLLRNLNRVLPRGELLIVPIIGSAIFGAPIHLAAGETRDSFLSRARAAVTDLRIDT